MNTRTKGRKAENEYKDMLTTLGYTVEQVKGSTRFNKSVDFFGMFDLISFKPQVGWVLTQVKSNSTKGQKKVIKEWKAKHNPPNCRVELVIRYDNKKELDRWRIIEF
jgi:hypothetical protein